MFKIPHITLVGLKRNTSSTGSHATALNMTAVESPGQAQGSGSLQSSEAISYGQVPFQYAKSTVPNKANVGKPIHQHTHFVVPTSQRRAPVRNAKVPRGGGS
jgi:hypothetical protein